MADTVAPRLPRGRHGLSRDEVEQDQRLRILVGMAEAMRVKGYIGTPVAEVIKRAGVSRETFYQLYSSKLECFLAAFDLVGDFLVGHLAMSLEGDGTPLERFERALTAYLETMASEPAYARLFLVEVYAAGPEAMDRRAALQQRIVDALVDLFDARDAPQRFACRALVAAISSMVTGPLVAGDLDAIRALGPPIVDHARLIF
ncbi:MAG: TetR/AcrR family transcriptional regulator [Acidimicrobiales bacterium]